MPFSVAGADGRLNDMNDTTMWAISQDVIGGPEVLTEVELPIPTPGPGEILVRVRAAGLNPTDWRHRGVSGLFLGEPPFVLGWDVSGEVAATGIGVTLFEPGNEVFGMLPYPYGHGAFAEYVVGPARAFAPKPVNLDHIQAAAIPLAALTAWQAIVDTANLQAGQRILIHAAAGGVGHFAVQIAKARGAHVIGTASAANHEFLREIGADETIDYRTTDFTETVHGVDVVLDSIDDQNSLRSLHTLRPGGLLVSLRAFGAIELATEAKQLGVRAVRMLVQDDHAGMIALAKLAESGALRPAVAGVYPFEEVAKAHALGETSRTVGKLVLTAP
ncbi:NADP-dependent oxidoreductase [Nocardia sp. NPDC050408]|uniref:NADP-dependent oxidoreductase n=1 Tax=Nocardia sp. NPDC050408 TaxID=3364319 RepID=UPI0037A655DA